MHRRVIMIALSTLVMFAVPVSTARAETFAERPVHDWTIRTTESAWGLSSDGSRTVVLAGSSHLVIPLPFYAVAIPLVVVLVLAICAAVWRLSRRRAGR